MTKKKADAERNGKPQGMSGPDRKYDRDEVTKSICARLALGEPMAVICRDMDIPVRTVNGWRLADAEIRAQFDEARDLGFDAIAHDCMGIADNQREHHQSRKVRIETRLKLLAKWDPKRYGDKQQLEHVGANGGPIQSISTVTDDPVKAAEIYQKVMAGEG